MRTKTKILIIGISVVVLACMVGAVFFAVKQLQSLDPDISLADEVTLSNEDIINITKPSIVRIVQDVSGTVTTPAFSIDLAELAIVSDLKSESVTVDLNERIQGSGFIVHEDGYILTNSHVVSRETIKLMLSAKRAQIVIDEALTEVLVDVNNGTFAEKDITKHTNDEIYAFGEEIVDHIRQNSEFSIEKKVTVLKPSSQASDMTDIVDDGYQASIISVNDGFIENDQDLALIKIDAINLPAIELSYVESKSVGSPVSLFGFPGSAEFNRKSLLEPSFTSGTISALKDSQNKEFSIYQTDAKVSHGSSGGPMLDDQGRVIGIITFQANDLQRQEGDNFAFAIPIHMVKENLKAHTVTDNVTMPEFKNEHTYAYNMKQGMLYREVKSCRKALEYFDAAQEVDQNFSTIEHVRAYKQDCEEMITAGMSIDSQYDVFLRSVREVGTLVWVLGGIMILLLGFFIGAFIYLLRKVRRNKRALEVSQGGQVQQVSAEKQDEQKFDQ